MKTLLLRRGSWAVTLTLAAGTLAFLTLFFFPRMRRLGELHDQLRLRQDYIAQTERIRPVIDKVRSDLRETGDYVQRWRSRCPRPDHLPALFGQISQSCQDVEVVTSRFEPRPQVELQTVARQPLSLAFSGPFAAVSTLLAKLEGLPALVWVDEMTLSRRAETGEAVKCELTLEVFVDRSKKSD